MSEQVTRASERVTFLSTAYTDVVSRVGIDVDRYGMKDDFSLYIEATSSQRQEFEAYYYKVLRKRGGYLVDIFDIYNEEFDSRLTDNHRIRYLQIAKKTLAWTLMCIGRGEKTAAICTNGVADGVYAEDIDRLSLGTISQRLRSNSLDQLEGVTELVKDNTGQCLSRVVVSKDKHYTNTDSKTKKKNEKLIQITRPSLLPESLLNPGHYHDDLPDVDIVNIKVA